MYEEFYQFKEKPFQLTPNPEYLYRSEKHKKALTYLEYGLSENVGYIVLSGEVGSGKTTTVEYILKRLDEDIEIANLVVSNMTFCQIIRSMLYRFGVNARSNDRAYLVELLNRYLIKVFGRNKRVLLVIDEAQNLSLDVLEELRMLSNLNKDNSPLLQTLLVGQPELLSNLRKPAVEQLRQRIAVHFHLTALDRNETVEYITHRLEIAGSSGKLFTPAAMDMIYDISGGIPRSINLICEGALVYGFADGARSISQDIIKQIKQDHVGIGIEPAAEDRNTPDSDPDKKSASEDLKKRSDANEKKINDYQNRVELRLKILEKQVKALELKLNSSNWSTLLDRERKRCDELLQRNSRLEMELERFKKVIN